MVAARCKPSTMLEFSPHSGAVMAESMGREADPPVVVTARLRLAIVGRVTLGEKVAPLRGDSGAAASTVRVLPKPASAALVRALISLSRAWRAASARPSPCETLLRMLPPSRLTLPLLASDGTTDAPEPARAAATGVRVTVGGAVDAPVNLFLTLVDACSVSLRLTVGARLARELILLDMAAACCCCFANAASRFCACAEAVAFLAEPPVKVLLVALMTLLRSTDAARTGPLASPSFLASDVDGATLTWYGMPSRSGRVTRIMTVFFSGGISSTVFCSAPWSSVTASRSRFVLGASLPDACRELGGLADRIAAAAGGLERAFGTGGTGSGRRWLTSLRVLVECTMAARLRVDVDASTR